MTAYLDSNVFVYAALYDGEKAAGAEHLLRSVVSGERDAATASLTFDEVAHVLEREIGRATALRQTERLLGFAGLRVVSIGEPEVRRMLKEMQEVEALSPRDGVHLAAAEKADADYVVTDDDDFAAVEIESRKPESF